MGLEGTAQLEREKRVTAAHLVDPAQRGPRQDELQSRVQQPVHGAERERPDHERGEALILGEPGRRVGAQAMCEQEPDRLLAEPSPGERHDLRRRGIEPLNIVDGNQHVACARELAEDAEHAHRDGALVGRRTAERCEQERDPECIGLRLRQLLEHLVDHALDQVAETGERKPGLRLHRPCLEHAVTALARLFDAGEPQCRLARSGLPLDHKPAWTGRGARRGKPPFSPARRPSRSPRSRACASPRP